MDAISFERKGGSWKLFQLVYRERVLYPRVFPLLQSFMSWQMSSYRGSVAFVCASYNFESSPLSVETSQFFEIVYKDKWWWQPILRNSDAILLDLLNADVSLIYIHTILHAILNVDRKRVEFLIVPYLYLSVQNILSWFLRESNDIHIKN